MAPDDSRYTEKETAAIIRRALELQRERSGDASSGALHLEEIQKIGAEVGIPADLIQRAAEELHDGRSDFSSSPWLGARSVQAREDTAPAPADGRALSDLIAVIEDAAGLDGGGRVTGSILQWRSRMGMVRVSVKPAAAGTVTARAEMHIYPAAAGLYPGLMGGLRRASGSGSVSGWRSCSPRCSLSLSRSVPLFSAGSWHARYTGASPGPRPPARGGSWPRSGGTWHRIRPAERRPSDVLVSPRRRSTSASGSPALPHVQDVLDTR